MTGIIIPKPGEPLTQIIPHREHFHLRCKCGSVLFEIHVKKVENDHCAIGEIICGNPKCQKSGKVSPHGAVIDAPGRSNDMKGNPQ